MSLIDFMHEHWLLTWFLAWGLWGVVWIALAALSLSFALASRLARLLTVLVRGWPPAHLDADGDWRPKPKADA